MDHRHRYRWAAPGDINAFFGLCLDNLTGLVLTVSILAAAFGFPAEFAVAHLVPGTAVGVLVGDLVFTGLAFRLARRTGRTDVTAMPLGLDTPSTIGIVLFVIGPAFLERLPPAADRSALAVEAAARHAWQIGACGLVISGLFKLACAMAAGTIRRLVPRAALLGSLAAIAVALIAFMPAQKMLASPVVGLTAAGITLAALTARIGVPLGIPGGLAAVLVAAGVHLAGTTTGWLPSAEGAGLDPAAALWPTGWLAALSLDWLAAWNDTVRYLPIIIPFAVGTVVGGIDCTESAAAAGDEYDTGQVIAVEAVATVIAGLCGGVIQTTPYIGHPAYKAMGGRAAYTLATALFIGLAGLTGGFAFLYSVIPEPAILPILLFIGLEITAQSYQATPERHFPAVAIACVPALAQLVTIYADRMSREAGASPGGPLAAELFSIRLLAAGFIVTSLVWAGMLASLIDHRLRTAAAWCLAAAALTLCGVMHSPFADGRLFLPWAIGPLPPQAAGRGPAELAVAYALLALLFSAWDAWRGRTRTPAHSKP